jgi:anti-sigma factor RsiW
VTDRASSSNGANGEHADHDPELIAALLDRDLSEADRAAAVARTASCTECRALLAELVALAAATAALPPPARPRAFTLSVDTAAELRRDRVREPQPSAARLTGEMTHSTQNHEAHDRLLIASLVDRSVSDSERSIAEQQLNACPACAQLLEELVALAAATRALPVPARKRDFTLTEADAERLRVSGWRRLMGAIGSTRDVFSRPLAIGLTTLGLAGLLVATVPMPFGTGGATSAERLSPIGAAAEDSSDGSAAGEEFPTQALEAQPLPEESGPAVAAAGPSTAPSGAGEAAPDASPGDLAPDVLFEGGETSPLPGEPDAQRNLSSVGFDNGGGFVPSPMFLVAGLLLLTGLGLFGLRWAARRLGDG